MSEEILKALMQLFAIIAKQDEGVVSNEREYVKTFLYQQLNEEAVNEYIALFDTHAGLDKQEKPELSVAFATDTREPKLTSVKDSVRILSICRKINKKLTQKQKVVVLVRLFELVNANRKFTDQRMAIINTASETFNISKEEFQYIETYIIQNEITKLDNQSILIINNKDNPYSNCKQIKTEAINGNIFILQIKSADLYFLRYTGTQDIFLNELPVNNKFIYLFAQGSTIKLPKGKSVYYSDVIAKYLIDTTLTKISYNVRNINYLFPTGKLGLRNISLSEQHGKLIGIMGSSGAGKSTMLNVLSGIENPSEGEILINGINLHVEKDKIKGIIGYIPQDDLLIEELTVFENLYYNAKLCFKDKKEQEIIELVNNTLSNLDLIETSSLKVGSPMKKMISGGQRKRLNIALELIREPSILFVDEPTSGLSSRDSDNVMDLLRELTLKGKLIFIAIHQPSSDIYKMFDKMIILDVGGYMIYYGNPVEAVMYFKKIDAQINPDVGECPSCGSVNPELVFNIIDAKVVDEFGRYTEHRKVSPEKWHEHYEENIEKNIILKTLDDTQEGLPSSLSIPSKIKQFIIYTLRDFYSKISNKQYIALNIFEAPVLAFILAFIIRYIVDPNSTTYIFRENENIPPYLFMCVIVALFIGLTVSAEEIFRDRKILKREAFLNLSRTRYLLSKLFILFTLSAIQSILFVLVGNYILEVRGMIFAYWFALFTTACFANILGLNISASFNSAVTIYILIPLLIIPQMILGGAMFSFDKLNRIIGKADKVPLIAEFMASKWVYEALMVRQYKDNNFEKYFYEIEKKESIADFKQVYYIPELIEKVNICYKNLQETRNVETRHASSLHSSSELSVAFATDISENLALLRNEIAKEKILPFEFINKLTVDSFNSFVAYNTKDYLKQLNQYYGKMFHQAMNEKEKIINYLLETDPNLYRNKRNAYHNESVADIVKKVFEKNKIIQYKDKLIQQVDPIYQDPDVSGFFSFRSHFYAPKKHFMGKYFDTFWFNMLFIWLMTLILYITLYFEHLKKLINIKIPLISRISTNK